MGLPTPFDPQDGEMRKTALLIAAWFGAGVLAVTTASIGVSMVGQQVTDDRPAPLSATEVREELAAAAAGASAPGPSVTAPGPSVPEPAVSVPSAPVAPPPTAAPSSPTAPVAVDPAPPAPAAPASAETRTYRLIGGTATLRFSASGVTVVTATPNAGFSVKVEPEQGDGVKVEFESDDHRSRVDGSWVDGPVDEVREDG